MMDSGRSRGGSEEGRWWRRGEAQERGQGGRGYNGHKADTHQTPGPLSTNPFQKAIGYRRVSWIGGMMGEGPIKIIDLEKDRLTFSLESPKSCSSYGSLE